MKTSPKQIGILFIVKMILREREVLDLFDKHCLQQAVTIPTCGKNTLDFALHRNLSILCEENHIVEKLYNISNHTPVALEFEMPIYTQQTATKTAYSFNAADYDEILKIMENSPFEPFEPHEHR